MPHGFFIRFLIHQLVFNVFVFEDGFLVQMLEAFSKVWNILKIKYHHSQDSFKNKNKICLIKQKV